MPKKRYKIWIDRIMAVLMILVIPIILLIVSSNQSKAEKHNSSAFEVQTEI